MLQIEGLLSSQLPTSTSPRYLRTTLTHRKRGRIINRQWVCLSAQICSNHPDRSGRRLCKLSLAEGDLGSLQETNTFPHPSHRPTICASERTTLQINLHRVMCTEMHTDNTLASSFPFFFYVSSIFPLHSLNSPSSHRSTMWSPTQRQEHSVHALPLATTSFCGFSSTQVGTESGKDWCKRGTGLCCNSAVSALTSKWTVLLLPWVAWRADGMLLLFLLLLLLLCFSFTQVKKMLFVTSSVSKTDCSCECTQWNSLLSCTTWHPGS